MIARAEADKLPYQLEVLTGGGTDAGAIQNVHSGVPSGCVSVPTRFVHTTSETVDLSDVEACINLLTGLLSNKISL
jgi:tetrahedral aminopeptidase